MGGDVFQDKAPDKRFLLRIPASLHARLKAAAVEHGVSLNRYCLRVLSGQEPVASVPDASRKRASQGGSLAADHLARAQARLLAVDVLCEAESWADVVCESQEVVDLALRGLLWWAGLEPPARQDVGTTLLRERKRLPPSFWPELPALAEAARRLRRDRDLAFLGSYDVTPWEFYRRSEAEAARQAARNAVRVVRTHVLGQ